MLEGISSTDGDPALDGRKSIDLCPEVDWVTQFALGYLPKPVVVLAQHERQTLLVEALVVAPENCVADIFPFERQVADLSGQVRTDGEAHQIVGIGHGMGFVEIIDAPDQTALRVTPGAE